MKKTIILFLIATILSGCSVYNFARVTRNYNKGTIVQKDFTYRIPFRLERGFIMVTVNIEEEDYNFVFDTGAPTVLSYELFEKLDYKKKSYTNSTRDSQGNVGPVSYTDIPELALGELTYKNIESQIIDLRKNQVFRCRNIDGIFGANHMSKAIWEIDYANQEILVTNDIKNLNLSEPYYSIDFFTEQHRKTPKVSIAINGKVVDEIIYDTGSAGYISLTENSLNFMDASLEKVEYFGYSAGVGVFGVNTNKTITSIIKIPLVELGQSKKLSVQNNIIMISNSSLLGNEFLKNYRTILDWNHNKIYLIKLGNLEKTSYKSFGFGTQLIDNNLLVTRTIPEISNLRVNDKILSINGQDFSDLNEESACDFFLNPEISANQTIEIVVLREGKEYTETLELLTLIE